MYKDFQRNPFRSVPIQLYEQLGIHPTDWYSRIGPLRRQLHELWFRNERKLLLSVKDGLIFLWVGEVQGSSRTLATYVSLTTIGSCIE